MYFHKISFHKFVWKALNIGVILAMLIATVAPAHALAASDSTMRLAQTNGACERGGSVYLPLISKGTSALADVVERLLANPGTVERALKYQVGKTYVYDYDLQVVTKSSQRNSEGTTSSDQSKTVIMAQVELSISSQEADGTFVGQIVMKSPYVCSADLKNGTDSVADTAELATELEKPLIFRQKPNGVVSSVSYPANARPTVINMQKGIINALQNELQEADTYAVAEVGGQGTYTPTYTLQEEGDTLNITKNYSLGDFSKLQKQGDDITSLSLSSVISSVLDGPKGVFSLVQSSEILETGDGAAEPNDYTDPNVTFDGATVWSTVNSAGKLALKEVKAASNMQPAALYEAYVDGGLEPIFEPPVKNPRGIDLTKVDLAQELADFEADPNNPEKFSRILDLVAADTAEGVVDKIIERLNATASDDTIAKAYIDLLAAIGTPKAQRALSAVLSPSVGAAGINASMSITTQEQALIDTVLLQSPISTTVDTLSQLSSDGTSPLQNTAISVLGAAVNNLNDEDPQKAQSLTDILVESLGNATGSDVEIYLHALGNTGMQETLATIAPYTNISTSLSISETGVLTEVIEAAAFNALRKIPGKQAEDLLVAALNDTVQPNGTRLLIADVLAERPDLSSTGAAALADFQIGDLAGSGTYTRQWGSWLGNSKLGVHLPGSFTVSNLNQLYLYASQEANGYVWDNRFSLARGQLLSQKAGSSQFFRAMLTVAGFSIFPPRDRYLNCAFNQSGLLWNVGYSWSQHVQIPIVWVITIGVDVKVAVNAFLSYRFEGNVCNLNNSSLSANLTPEVWATATGEAYLNLRLARGGLGINATILRTEMPATLTLSYNGSNFRFCADVKVRTQPLSGYIYAFADVGVSLGEVCIPPFGCYEAEYWYRVFEGTLATFNVGQYSYDVLVQCW